MSDRNENLMKPIASVEDIPYDLAYSAHRWSSHVPEERAEQARRGYADDVNAFHAEMLALAVEDGQKEVLAVEIERFRQGYLKHYGALLAAQSRTASSMITGPSNFPVARNRKRMDAADKRRKEFLEWREKAVAAVRKAVLAARSEGAALDARWAAIERDVRGSLAEIEAIDERNSPYTRASFVNSIVGKAERLAGQGETALVWKLQALMRSYNESHKKPAVSARHKFWKLAEAAADSVKAHDEEVKKGPEVIARGDGVEVIADPTIDRVQIVFASKPGKETAAVLKSEGWRWSPSAGAWQRKLTNAARHSAVRLTRAVET